MATQNKPEMEPTAEPIRQSTPHFVPKQDALEQLILLRISDDVRHTLDGQATTNPTRQPSQLSSSLQTPIKPRKKNRWFRMFVGLLLFCVGLSCALSVGLLELRFLQETQKARAVIQIDLAYQQAQRSLRKGNHAQIYRSLPRYLQQLEKTLQKLTNIRKNLCPLYEKSLRPHMRSSSLFGVELHEQTLAWQSFLWKYLKKEYILTRSTLFKSPKKLPTSGNPICKQNPERLMEAFKKQLWSSSQRLLQNAKTHIRWYGWCKMKWAKLQMDPTHSKGLQSLRTQKCQRSCRGRSSRSCKRCLSNWRTKLGLSSHLFRLYRRTVQREKRGKCMWWSKQKSGHHGVFHLGEYFWRVHRVLAYTSLLARYNVCGEKCRSIREDWGFRLQLKSKPARASLYLQLWPAQTKAPTTVLRQLTRRKFGVADGKDLWIPAFRKELLGTKMPRNFWLLLRLFDPSTKKRGMLLLQPIANGILRKTIKLKQLRIHNDGRQSIRFVSLSPRGRWLSFVTLRQLSWESTPTFASPYCWQTPLQRRSTLNWRAAVSLYPLGTSATPTSQGQHHFLKHWPRALQFVNAPKQPQLLLSTPHLKAPKQPTSRIGFYANSLGIETAARRASLWKMLFSSRLREPPSLQAITSQPRQGSVDLPIVATSQQTLLFRLGCQNQYPPLMLLQIPPSIPPQINQPRNNRLVHVASNRHAFALLLRHKHTNKTSFALYPRQKKEGTAPTRIIQLKYQYRQILPTQNGFLFAGGTWGSPLQHWLPTGIKTLLPGREDVRYLDPAYHSSSHRIFVIMQRKILGPLKHQTTATFLISQPAQESSE